MKIPNLFGMMNREKKFVMLSKKRGISKIKALKC